MCTPLPAVSLPAIYLQTLTHGQHLQTFPADATCRRYPQTLPADSYPLSHICLVTYISTNLYPDGALESMTGARARAHAHRGHLVIELSILFGKSILFN